MAASKKRAWLPSCLPARLNHHWRPLLRLGLALAQRGFAPAFVLLGWVSLLFLRFRARRWRLSACRRPATIAAEIHGCPLALPLWSIRSRSSQPNATQPPLPTLPGSPLAAGGTTPKGRKILYSLFSFSLRSKKNRSYGAWWRTKARKPKTTFASP